MIRELRIRGLGVIDESVIPFAPGLTVLTGETGAGKTMVLTGLTLLMGSKADGSVVRAGRDRADIDGVWWIPADARPALAERLEEAGAATEPVGDAVELILGRSVAAEGRSRAFAGGRAVPAATLQEVTEHLIAVHGQSDQLLLRDPRQQRDLLDRFAGEGAATALLDYRAAYLAWRDAERELADLVEHRQEREREAALLRHGIGEIEALAPVAGEDEALKVQAAVLAHSGDLVAAVGTAHALLVGGADDRPDAAGGADLIAQARRELDRAAALDPELVPLCARLDDLVGGIDDVAREVADYARGIDIDPQRQATVEDRRQRISALKRKYGPTLDEVLAWWAHAERTVQVVDGADERIAALRSDAAARREEVCTRAGALTRLRVDAAARLAAAVTEELQALAMADAHLAVEVRTVDDPGEFTPDGADTVAMLLRPHAGGDFRALGKGASGGELSRIMLAIEVVLAGVNSVPTFVFDEVDAGIGGRVAVEVGRRLARLARGAQVVVVTHLPQVAAFADQHVVVSKDGDGRVTSADVTVVAGADRVAELVRMLSGLEGSTSGAAHAEELLALAAGEAAASVPSPAAPARRGRRR